MPHCADDTTTQAGAVPRAPGEVLVTYPYGPAFPGLLNEPEPLATVDDTTTTGLFPLVSVLFRRSVVEWIGIYLEAQYGSAQIRYEWRDDMLAIHDDPWDEEPEEQPRLIHPDRQGRYLIQQPWLALTAAQNAATRQHTDALAILAGNDSAHESAAMLEYLSDCPRGRDSLYGSLQQVIRLRTEASARSDD